MEHILKNAWEPLLAPESEKPYYQKLRQFLKEEYSTHVIYPNANDIFNELHYT
ncbi:uracil-DNA glycosylase, partial [Bacillus pseudomycoides]|nr:uracil-DNA glycosylase [Bacillus pseudomycoides]